MKQPELKSSSFTKTQTPPEALLAPFLLGLIQLKVEYPGRKFEKSFKSTPHVSQKLTMLNLLQNDLSENCHRHIFQSPECSRCIYLVYMTLI